MNEFLQKKRLHQSIIEIVLELMICCVNYAEYGQVLPRPSYSPLYLFTFSVCSFIKHHPSGILSGDLTSPSCGFGRFKELNKLFDQLPGEFGDVGRPKIDKTSIMVASQRLGRCHPSLHQVLKHATRAYGDDSHRRTHV